MPILLSLGNLDLLQLKRNLDWLGIWSFKDVVNFFKREVAEFREEKPGQESTDSIDPDEDEIDL